MSITLGAATAYVGQLTGKQAGSIAGKVLSERMWGLKTARASLREVPPPRPRRVLARWLKQPATLHDVLLSPDRPGDSVVAEIDRVLCRNPRWASLPGDVRAERAEKIALGVYDAVLSSHTPAWSTRIAASRTMEKLHQIHDAVERSAAPPPAAEGDSAAGTGGSRELLEARLGLAPPEQHETVLAAWGVDQARTWALVCALTDPSVEPSDVVRDWSQVRPQWLAGAGPAVLVAAAELAAAYGQSGWAGHLLLEAAHGGGSPRQVLIARATLLFDGDGRDDAPTVLAKVGTAQESPEPFVRALHALLARDWDRTKAVLAEWEPRDRRERVRKWAIADRLVFLSATSRTVTKEILSESIGLARSLLAETWSDAAALTVAHRLTMRTGLSGSEQPYADLREARGLAVKVRDGCRVWRGDSGTAVAAACEAALHAGDLSAVVDLGTAAGQATPKEASHPEVVARVAVAAAMLGRPVDTAALSALTEHDRERVLAQAARAAGEDDEWHWRAALMAAQDEPQRATALAGLAGTGTLSLPGLDELEAEHPDVAGQIRAIGEIARGQHAQAVSRLRGRARQNAQAAALLAQAYEQAGDIDAAVATFQEAARAFSDPDLAWAAVVALFRGGRHDDAAKTLGGVLASAPDGWPGRAQALHMAARLAAGADDLVRATDLLRTAVELDPSDARRRWHLVELLLSRTDTAAAWRVYAAHPEPLEPRDLAQAHMWLVLQRAEGDPEDLARGAVRLTRRFPDDEGLAARAVALLIAPNPKKDLAPLPPELLSDVHTLVSDYTRRWPEGAIRAITMDEDDPEATLAKVGGMARRGPDAHKDLLRLAGQVARQEIPLGMLAAFAHRPYAEVVVLRGLGILAAGHPDPKEHARSVADAHGALGGTCLADTTAFAVLAVLPDTGSDVLIAAFRSVETVDEILADALQANEGLAGRSTLTVGWDEQQDRPSMTLTAQEQADRYAEEAGRILALVRRLQRRPSRPTGDDDPRDTRFAPWMPTAETAAAEGRAVWADDGALRALVRALGAPAFGTAALMEALVETGALTEKARASALAGMVRAGIWAPVDAAALAEIAEDDDWAPSSAAAVLASPALWLRPEQAHALLAGLLPQVARNRPDHLAGWLRLCARAVAYAHPAPLPAASVSGTLLAAAVHLVQAGPPAVPDMLTAVRAGLADAAQDPDVVPDPLATFTAVTLRLPSAGIAGPEDPRALPALFSKLDDDDRALVSDLLEGS